MKSKNPTLVGGVRTEELVYLQGKILIYYLYNMILLTSVIFVLSAGLTSGGILLGNRLRSMNRVSGLTSMLYFLIFIFTFGFYALWGQTIIKVMISEIVTDQLLKRIIHTFVLMGLPFVVLAWLMLIKFTREITLRKKESFFTFAFLFIHLGLVFATGWAFYEWPELDAMLLLKYFYLGPGSITIFLSVLFLITQKEKRMLLLYPDRLLLAASLAIFYIIEAILLINYTGNQIIGLAFIFFFFTGKAFVPVWIRYRIKQPEPVSSDSGALSFKDFCTNYDISARESEIVKEICNGLSNGEIADKLFITLQTVKDHTHRIYIKANVRNRMQLMTLVQKYEA